MTFSHVMIRGRIGNAWRAGVWRNTMTARTASLSTLPTHKIVPMPSLSPTMEVGSIAKWNLKVGDRFETGTSLCDVETDKATVSFDATDEGFVAKILVSSGDIKVGQPLLVTVEEQSDVKAFENFTVAATATATAAAAPAPAPVAPVAKPAPPAPVAASIAAPVAPSSGSTADRVFASPLAKKVAREQALDLASVRGALNGVGSGFNGRIVASDVLRASDIIKSQPAAVAAPVVAAPAVETSLPNGFSVGQLLSERQTLSKKTVPHYHVSMEVNMASTLALREKLNALAYAAQRKEDPTAGVTVMDFVAKAAALAMKQVPDVNGAWMETFVRKYEQVDINFIMGSGEQIACPVIRSVDSKGLGSISKQLLNYESQLFSTDSAETEKFLADQEVNALGTFTIYNLGVFGVKSVAPIVLTPQACALAIGAIVDTVVPKANAAEGQQQWEVAPMLTATITSDHRVVDGALAAQWLSAFKSYLEKPETMLL